MEHLELEKEESKDGWKDGWMEGRMREGRVYTQRRLVAFGRCIREGGVRGRVETSIESLQITDPFIDIYSHQGTFIRPRDACIYSSTHTQQHT